MVFALTHISLVPRNRGGRILSIIGVGDRGGWKTLARLRLRLVRSVGVAWNITRGCVISPGREAVGGAAYGEAAAVEDVGVDHRRANVVVAEEFLGGFIKIQAKAHPPFKPRGGLHEARKKTWKDLPKPTSSTNKNLKHQEGQKQQRSQRLLISYKVLKAMAVFKYRKHLCSSVYYLFTPQKKKEMLLKPKQKTKIITKDIVEEIRNSFWEDNKPPKELSKLYNLNRNTITNLLLNKTHTDPNYFVDKQTYLDHSKQINGRPINAKPPSNARFSKDEVLLIYRLWGQGLSVSEIDQELGIGVIPTVWRIIYGKTYKSLHTLYFQHLGAEPRQRRMDRIINQIQNNRKP